MPRVRPLRDEPEYRGFEIGYIVGLHGYLAAWRIVSSSALVRWVEGHIYVDTIDEIPQLARECIDYYYNEYTLETQLGSTLTMTERLAFHKAGLL